MFGKKPNFSIVTDDQLRPYHWVLQRICITIIKYYSRYKYQVYIHGKENQPKGFQSYIVAANHVSALDPPLVSVALEYQPISYMAKKELFEKPLMRWYNQMMSSFSVNREKLEISTVKSALKVLKHGKWALGIFPEGTRQKDGTLAEAKKGVAYFSKAAWKPILPVAFLHSTPPTGKPRIDIQIGHFIQPDKDMDALTQRLNETLAAMTQDMRSKLPY